MSPAYWALVPAAGVGLRMGAQVPKQYLTLHGRSILDHSLDRLLDHPRIEGVYLALSPDDGWWPESGFFNDPRVTRVDGGRERCHSVLNALYALSGCAAADDWVLVHDAARPCLRRSDLERLIEQLSDHPAGGLLGRPVHDTMKRAGPDRRIEATVPREGLWHAYTPQMFRLGPLRQALERALAEGRLVTDEASAMELAGDRPLLVEGAGDNLKITRPEDLALAAFYLEQQEGG
jgi:2-C-methyl-D-erythritol 4-phosphate cytidylyltransferase